MFSDPPHVCRTRTLRAGEELFVVFVLHVVEQQQQLDLEPMWHPGASALQHVEVYASHLQTQNVTTSNHQFQTGINFHEENEMA